MKIEWSPKFRTGNEDVDLQQRHMELMGQFNKNAEHLLKGEKSKEEFIQFLFEWFAGHTYHEDTKVFKAQAH